MPRNSPSGRFSSGHDELLVFVRKRPSYVEFFPLACVLKQIQECAGFLLSSFRFLPFLLPSADTKRTISKSTQICFQGNFPPNVINCSSFCKNRRHRLNSDFLKGRKRMPRTSVSSSFHFPFLNAESSLVCGIPFFFLFLKKEGQRERDASAFFLFFSGKRKKKTPLA